MSQSKAVAKALASGFVFDARAFDLISGLPPDMDIDVLLAKLMEQKGGAGAASKRITEDDVKQILPTPMVAPEETIPLVEEETEFEMISDPTPAIAPAEAMEGFSRLFRDRYDRLLTVVKKRPDTKGVGSTVAGRGVAQGQKIKVAGLLTNKGHRKSGVELTIDDPSGTLKAVCQDEGVVKSAMEAPLDSMVVLEVSRSKSGQIYANSLTLPDVPDRKTGGGASHKVYAVLLSDLHIGSKMFLADDFQRFVRWMNGKLGDLDIVNHIQYVVIAGDLIDGVGVYPGQEFQLAEKDPKKQYENAAKLLSDLPGRVQLVISPGNHDAVRQALPQPAVPLDLAEPLYKMGNVRWVGDPAYIKLHGVTFLVYHGKSLDDVIATTPNLAYNRPVDAMKLLLRSRHLAPTYGKRTALSPELRDFLVIDPIPDVFHSGHVHAYGEQDYRGTIIVNSGTWQAQTQFQVNMGMEPTPSIIPVIDLSDLSVIRRSFASASFVGA